MYNSYNMYIYIYYQCSRRLLLRIMFLISDFISDVISEKMSPKNQNSQISEKSTL